MKYAVTVVLICELTYSLLCVVVSVRASSGWSSCVVHAGQL